jgi:hypothetical protein
MRRLETAALQRNTAANTLSELGWQGLTQLCRDVSAQHAPDRELSRDPRTGLPVLCSPARAGRLSRTSEYCPVCDEDTCPAVDVVELPGSDSAWLTPNLYPMVFPFDEPSPASGIHLVHWSSSFHDGGWPGSTPDVAMALLRQLADAEEFLLHAAPDSYPASGAGHRGHVGVIKNRGRRVGGSVYHDHQQILLAATAPIEPARSVGLAASLLAKVRPDCLVENRDDLATTLVPDFMARPLHTFVVPHGDPVGWLHHMQPATRDAVAVCLTRLFAAVDTLMSADGREPAWSLTVHTGQGCGPLFELRPLTQTMGGFEQLGLYLCEERPCSSAARLAEALPVD